MEKNIQFQVVHRLRPRRDGKPKSIVAKFERRKDRNLVLKTAREKLKSNEYGVHEQYPPEIIARRNELWQAFRYHQDRDDNVRFYDDKLFVNGMRLYSSSYRLRPEQTIAPEPVQQLQHPGFSVVSALNQQRIEAQGPQIQQDVPHLTRFNRTYRIISHNQRETLVHTQQLLNNIYRVFLPLRINQELVIPSELINLQVPTSYPDRTLIARIVLQGIEL